MDLPEFDSGDCDRDTETKGTPHTDPSELIVSLDEIGLEGIEIPHSRPAHLELASATAYVAGRGKRSVSLVKDRPDDTVRIAAFENRQAAVLLIRRIPDTEGDENHRTYYVCSVQRLTHVVSELCERYAFSVSSVVGEFGERLPERLHPD